MNNNCSKEQKKKSVTLCVCLYKAYPVFSNCKGYFGGAEVNAKYLVRQLIKDFNDTIHFIVADYGQPSVTSIDNIYFHKVRYYHPHMYTQLRYKIARKWHLIKTILTVPCDAFLVITAGQMSGVVSVIGKLIRHKLFIQKVCSDKDTDFAFQRSRGLFHYLIYKYGLFHADAVICETTHQRHRLPLPCKSRSTIIPNALPLRPLSSVESQKKEFILWAGRNAAMKKPEIFVELAQRCPNQPFVLILLNKDLTSSYAATISSVKNITYVDYVDSDCIQSYFDKAQCLVNTSTYEGFPISFLQAGFGATPIVSLSVDPDSIITNHDLGYFCGGNFDRMVQCIQAIDDQWINRCGYNAYTYVSTYHTVEKAAACYQEFITKLLSER